MIDIVYGIMGLSIFVLGFSALVWLLNKLVDKMHEGIPRSEQDNDELPIKMNISLGVSACNQFDPLYLSDDPEINNEE